MGECTHPSVRRAGPCSWDSTAFWMPCVGAAAHAGLGTHAAVADSGPTPEAGPVAAEAAGSTGCPVAGARAMEPKGPSHRARVVLGGEGLRLLRRPSQNTLDLVSYTTGRHFLSVLEAGKFEIRVPAQSGSSASPCLGLQTAACSLCPPVADGRHWGRLFFL